MKILLTSVILALLALAVAAQEPALTPVELAPAEVEGALSAVVSDRDDDKQLSSPPPAETEKLARRLEPLETDPEPSAGRASGAVQSERFEWSKAVQQSLLFLGIQHGFAISTQTKTRKALRGPFFPDYFKSVSKLGGWDDGGKFFTNYVAHPMQGAMTGFVQVQNDPKGRNLHFENKRAYWKSRGKALAWSAAWSTQFEIGPLSQASIGNVGHYRKQTWIDIVVTPTAGTALLIAEDLVDRYLIRAIERRYPKMVWLKVLTRMALNPTRSTANMIAFEWPWHRYTTR